MVEKSRPITSKDVPALIKQDLEGVKKNKIKIIKKGKK